MKKWNISLQEKHTISFLHITLFTLIMILLLCAFSSFGIPNGTLKGRVKDKITSKPILFANVMVILNDTLLQGGTTTDFEGNFVISINPDIYTIKVTSKGYKSIVQKGIAINADELRYLEFELEENKVEVGEEDNFESIFLPIKEDRTPCCQYRIDIKLAMDKIKSEKQHDGVIYSPDSERGYIRSCRCGPHAYYKDELEVLDIDSLPAPNYDLISDYSQHPLKKDHYFQPEQNKPTALIQSAIEIEEEKVKVYPNPSRGEIAIISSNEIKEAFLSNLSGKLLECYNMDYQNNYILNLNRFPDGIYFISYLLSDKWKTAKVILTR